MDAYVVDAVPPYADLLGGKLVASLIASKEVGNKFQERYGGREGIISGKHKQARLTLVTVTSALGRSSVYNRLRLVPNPKSETDQPVVELRKLGATTGTFRSRMTFSHNCERCLKRMDASMPTDTNLGTAQTGASGLRGRGCNHLA